MHADRLTPLGVMLLALLHEGDMHPYEMIRLLRLRHDDRLVPVTNGTVYHTVGRLQKLGLLAEQGVDREGNRPERTTYRVTEAGRNMVPEWVRAELPRIDRPEQFRVALSEAHNLPPDEVVDLLATGLFRGVTTNPAILDKAGLGSIDIPDVIRWATAAGAERVFVQAWGTSADDMVELGRQFRQISGNVVVKVPYSLEGVVAAKRLSEDGEVLVTAVHSDAQVLPIVLANATYLAPFVGRMDQAGRDGLDAALGMQRALRGLDTDTRLLAGSLRQPAQVLQLAQAGVSHFTMAPAVWRLFFEDDVTRAAVSDFQRLATGTPA